MDRPKRIKIKANSLRHYGRSIGPSEVNRDNHTLKKIRNPNRDLGPEILRNRWIHKNKGGLGF